jgi:hypothetical protein
MLRPDRSRHSFKVDENKRPTGSPFQRIGAGFSTSDF